MSIFSEVKENVTIEQAAQYLGLKLVKTPSSGERRYKCPVCETKDPDPLCIGDESFTCYGTGKKPHGDVIALVAHCKQISQTEAAKLLAKHFLAAPASTATKPRQAQATEGEGRSEALAGSALRPLIFDDWEHPTMKLLKLDPGVLQAIGGGIDHTDLLDERICVPLRKENGELVGYLAIATIPAQKPLMLFWPEDMTIYIEPEKRSQDEMRKLLRIV
ncbi:hypothetical protein XI02_42260 [Bradyrhizobium sp. CCBAU 21365]|uniref:hypothetical protein n=1 Tax=Bradyrhizobium sp. CCBAU 21365 TaxID=1325083 RepID=UPI00188B3E45|nr:hypothetical protein [Bradyrhizobium sp. CCBAU 21365]QOZ20840.1 hypothetical protein XI02_42260 [Bradyrhizobium sp. CCBAU 21365]